MASIKTWILWNWGVGHILKKSQLLVVKALHDTKDNLVDQNQPLSNPNKRACEYKSRALNVTNLLAFQSLNNLKNHI